MEIGRSDSNSVRHIIPCANKDGEYERPERIMSSRPETTYRNDLRYVEPPKDLTNA